MAYVVVAVVQVATLAAGVAAVPTVAQWLLMPVLGLVLVAAVPGWSRLTALVAVALFCSWLGDTVPYLLDGDAAFLALVGFFFCAQVAFVAAFWPARARTVVARTPGAAVCWLLPLGGLAVACFDGAGVLFVPVLAYGATLTATAMLSTGLGVVTGVGGSLFFVSDSLIALGAFTSWDPAWRDVAVMATYVVAQGLIVLGTTRAVSQEVPRSALRLRR